MIYYYVNSTTGVDEIGAGSEQNPFKTLDFCISQIHTRNIRALNLEDEEEVLELLERYSEENKNEDENNIVTLDEKPLNEEEIYLYNIINRAFDDDVTIYIGVGTYSITNDQFLTGSANKHLYIIGKGLNTLVSFDFPDNNVGRGTVDFNVHLYKLKLGTNKTSGTNYLLSACNIHYKNVLFYNLPKYDYGFLSMHNGKVGKSTMQYCVQNNTTSLFRGTVAFDNDNCFGNYGKLECAYDCSNDFLNNDNNKRTDTPMLDDEFRILDNSVDTTKIGLYVGEYSWGSNSCLLKMNDKYYSINEEFWNNQTKTFIEVGSLDFEKGFNIENLTKEVTYGADTFFPIDKFDNFQIVFENESIKKLKINGYKIDEKIVETNTIDLRMVESFNNFEINGENAKCLIKINGEDDIYTYDFNTNELVFESVDNIKTNGININDIVNIDFNKLKDELELKNITFIFYLTQDSLIENISVDYLEVGEFMQKSATETRLKIGYKNITIQPNFNASLVKINVL